MSLQSPLARVLGLGSAKEGPGHWWAQRVTAVALAPLGLWFIFSIIGLQSSNYQFVLEWIAQPAHAIMLILLLLALVYHSALGLQVVVEDYTGGAARVLLLLAVKFLHVILVVAGVFAVVSVAVGAGE